jgi:hypothetical protein
MFEEGVMRTQRRNSPSAVAAVAMLALALGGQPAVRAASDAPPNGAQSEGIKVHGQWTIDVLNPDGSLASHHDFKNALDSFGARRLAEMLARLQSPGVWNIGLWQVGTARKPCPSYFNGACVIGEVGSTDPEAQFKTMTVLVPASGPNEGKLVLSGTATVEADGDIYTVYTDRGYCAGNVAPANCAAYRDSTFTRKDFASPIVVLAGQIVQVTVVISFS